MPTYASVDYDKSQLPRADYKVYTKEIPDGVEPKTVSVDFKSKPSGWLYKTAKGGIYGTLRLIIDGAERKFKVFLSENNYNPAAVAAPSHPPLTDGGAENGGTEDTCPF